MASKNSTLIDKLFFAGLLIGVAFLSFVAGLAVNSYEEGVFKMVSGEVEIAQQQSDFKETIKQFIKNKELRNIEPMVQNARVETWDRAQTQDGYTLIAIRYSDTAYLINMEGKIVHRWTMPFTKAWPNPKHISSPKRAGFSYVRTAKAYPNGDLLAVYENSLDTPYGYGIAKLDKDSKLLWRYNENAHHDVYVDQENGNIYGLKQVFVKQIIPGLEGLSYPILADDIITLSPSGNEISRISLLEAFRNSPYAQLLYTIPKNEILWDRLHTNSIYKLEPSIAAKFPMFRAGQLLISMRNINTIAVLDPETKKIVWAYQGIWKAQHSPVFLANGHILLMDNKGFVSGGNPYSRLLEIDPVTLAINWVYTGNDKRPYYSEAYGYVQRLENGNTVATESYNGRVFEITKDGKIIWDYRLSIPDRVEDKVKLTVKGIPHDELLEQNLNIPGAIGSMHRYEKAYFSFLNSNSSTH